MFNKLINKLEKKFGDNEIVTVNLSEIIFNGDFKTDDITWSKEEIELIDKIKKYGYKPKIDGYINVTNDMICVNDLCKLIVTNIKNNPRIKVRRKYVTMAQYFRYGLLLKILRH